MRRKQSIPSQVTRIVVTAFLMTLVIILSVLWTHSTQAQLPKESHTNELTPTSSLTPHNCNPLWNIVPSPNASTGDNYLSAVDAISNNDVWAVGYYLTMGRYLTLTQHWDGTQWSIVPSPNPGLHDNYLYSISAVSPTDIWAVGTFNNDPVYSATHLLTLHWDGTQWNVISNPDPGGNYANSLYSVKAFASADVWSTGFYRYNSWYDLRMHWTGQWVVSSTPAQPYGYLYGIDGLSSGDIWTVGGSRFTSYAIPLIEHFTNGTWTIMSAPTPSQSEDSFLYGVTVIASDDIWAVGSRGNYGQPQHSFAEHWDGTQWSLMPVPDRGKLSGIKALAPNDIWAVGEGAFLHWDGATWTPITDLANGGLTGIDALAPDNIWAVGTQVVDGIKKTLIEHYSPNCLTATPSFTPTPTLTPTSTPCVHTWTTIPSLNMGTGDNVLNAVSVNAPDDVWAVGYYSTTGRYKTLIEHWNGTVWSIIPGPNPGTYDNVLRGVSAVSTTDAWAVGDYSNDPTYIARHVLTLHWDGTQWNIVPNPDPGANGTNYLNGVKALASNDVWAVGSYTTTSRTELTMHWDGTQWLQRDSFASPAGILRAVDGVASNDVWAVGQQTWAPHQVSLFKHWTGSSWQSVSGGFSSVDNHIAAISAIAPNNVWAVGDYVLNGITYTMITRWNQSVWSIYPVTNTGALTGIKSITANDIWATGGSSFQHWNGSAWSVVPGSMPGGNLLGIDTIGSDDIWAVGSQTVGGVQQTLIEHYLSECAPSTATTVPTTTNSPTTTLTPTITPTPTKTSTPTITNTSTPTTSITIIPTATPCTHTWIEMQGQNVGSGDSELNAVEVIAPDDIWAVGYYTDMYNNWKTLIQHWNGAQWITMPGIDLDNENVLRGISAISSDDVWAVGSYGYSSASNHALTIHWDGSQWSNVPNPDPGGNYAGWLETVEAFSPNNVWALGLYREYQPLELIMHWDGAQWLVLGSPSGTTSDLIGIDGLTPNDVWAVGYTSGAPNTVSLTEHYNGTSWSVVPGAFITATNTMNDIAMVKSDDVWGVGYYEVSGTKISMIQRWNGTQWINYPIPASSSLGELFGVEALAANDVWAVGYNGFLHWDGTGWSRSSNPITGTLQSIDSISLDYMYAVGSRIVGGTKQILIEHYQSACPPPTMTPAPPTLTRTPTNTPVPPTSTLTTTPIATATSCSIAFSDVPPGSTFYPYIECLACARIIDGYPDGTYRPGQPVTRGQAAKIIANSAHWSEIIPDTRQTFNDVPPDSTFWVYAERAYLHSAFAGYACGGPNEPCPGLYFRPANSITRGQIAKVVSMSAQYNDQIPPAQQTFSDVPPGSTFWLYIERMALHAIINGYEDGTYRPANSITRGQIAKIASKAFFPECAAAR